MQEQRKLMMTFAKANSDRSTTKVTKSARRVLQDRVFRRPMQEDRRSKIQIEGEDSLMKRTRVDIEIPQDLD